MVLIIYVDDTFNCVSNAPNDYKTNNKNINFMARAK